MQKEHCACVCLYCGLKGHCVVGFGLFVGVLGWACVGLGGAERP